MDVFRRVVRSQGIRIILYVDDLLLLGRSHEIRRHKAFIDALINELGLVFAEISSETSGSEPEDQSYVPKKHQTSAYSSVVVIPGPPPMGCLRGLRASAIRRRDTPGEPMELDEEGDTNIRSCHEEDRQDKRDGEAIRGEDYLVTGRQWITHKRFIEDREADNGNISTFGSDGLQYRTSRTTETMQSIQIDELSATTANLALSLSAPPVAGCYGLLIGEAEPSSGRFITNGEAVAVSLDDKGSLPIIPKVGRSKPDPRPRVSGQLLCAPGPSRKSEGVVTLRNALGSGAGDASPTGDDATHHLDQTGCTIDQVGVNNSILAESSMVAPHIVQHVPEFLILERGAVHYPENVAQKLKQAILPHQYMAELYEPTVSRTLATGGIEKTTETNYRLGLQYWDQFLSEDDSSSVAVGSVAQPSQTDVLQNFCAYLFYQGCTVAELKKYQSALKWRATQLNSFKQLVHHHRPEAGEGVQVLSIDMILQVTTSHKVDVATRALLAFYWCFGFRRLTLYHVAFEDVAFDNTNAVITDKMEHKSPHGMRRGFVAIDHSLGVSDDVIAAIPGVQPSSLKSYKRSNPITQGDRDLNGVLIGVPAPAALGDHQSSSVRKYDVSGGST
ncbi:hypothetical protein SARC_10398 [Sphaeroforma arctica JP610]|uniref:Uncharacterized protein n=1 Tax=Sphaeroforma arctica JP610 TaxID=667725 RepID=A0A0L0FK34_9EUKA|nr:hypothetical protein SARC_10398 [Sphaeroforma arctica JP610]KNC77132.1 hypothetical protein SARC_10398 [Sphaeroforma arctica JP610]|eukprot:XP_014151034.1 hypothetical protein SARC_10398 [Sphaeroforma arctica JP610]